MIDKVMEKAKSKSDILNELFKENGLTKEDIFKHQHYTIITRQGIDKIQAKERIFVQYEVINCEPNFAVVKAFAEKDQAKIQTFGSALKGSGFKDGNCNTWYVMEMAEKRAMSRAVLKLTGFYELGVFGEDESDEFKRVPTIRAEEEKPKIEVKKEWISMAKMEQLRKPENAKYIDKYLQAYKVRPEELQELEELKKKYLK